MTTHDRTTTIAAEAHVTLRVTIELWPSGTATILLQSGERVTPAGVGLTDSWCVERMRREASNA